MSPNEYCKSLGARTSELDGVSTWRSWSVHRVTTRVLGGEFCEKMKFVVFET